jgi:SprT protein
MRLLRQLEFGFRNTAGAEVDDPGAAINDRNNNKDRHLDLEETARELLHANGAGRIAREIRVEWNPRLKTCAGRADYRSRLISLNPLLVHHPVEIGRTFRHELAHILAQFRARRRRILPHGVEWQHACCDLGVSGEKRCHNLPFPAKGYAARLVYRCPNCHRNFPRVRRVKRVVACLACCHAHNGGEFDARFRLCLVERTSL